MRISQRLGYEALSCAQNDKLLIFNKLVSEFLQKNRIEPHNVLGYETFLAHKMINTEITKEVSIFYKRALSKPHNGLGNEAFLVHKIINY